MSKDELTIQETAFKSFQELIDAPAYWPSLKNRQLADWYDQAQEARNDKRRAHRI